MTGFRTKMGFDVVKTRGEYQKLSLKKRKTEGGWLRALMAYPKAK